MRFWGLPSTAFLLSLAACNKGETANVQVTTGQESGSLTCQTSCGPDDQKVAKVKITAWGADQKTQLTATATPGGSFDLGLSQDDVPLKFDLSGMAEDGTVIARGCSITIPIADVFGTLPLFIQRLGAFARPDGNLIHSHVHAPAAVFQERYLLLSGGDDLGDSGTGTPNTQLGDFYDLLAQAPAVGGNLTRSAQALVVRDTSVLSIDATGATWTDLTGSATAYDVALPTGVVASDFLGGRAIDTPSGATWIVGATRDDPPTSTILVVGADSSLSVRNLSAPRSGAAAAWIGTSLIVAGGNADPSVNGIESIAETGVATSLNFAADGTKGAALTIGASLAGTSPAILAGGTVDGAAAPTRTVNLACPTLDPSCAVPIDAATINVANVGTILTSRSQAFAVTNATIVVGDDAAGQTHVFLVHTSMPSVAEIPLKEPRKGATALPTPNGLLAIMGGTLLSGAPATSVELYFPTSDQACNFSSSTTSTSSSTGSQ